MKLTSALAIAMAAGGVCAAPAFAQDTPAPAPAAAPEKPSTSGFYLGGAINFYHPDKDFVSQGLPVFFSDQPSPGAVLLRVGYALNEYVAVEVEAGFGAARQKYSLDGSSTDAEIGAEMPMGAHLVLTLPVSKNVYVMGKGGYSSVKFSRDFQSFDPGDVEVKGASYGAGIGFRDRSWDYRMEYSFISGDNSAESGVLGLVVLNHF